MFPRGSEGKEVVQPLTLPPPHRDHTWRHTTLGPLKCGNNTGAAVAWSVILDLSRGGSCVGGERGSFDSVRDFDVEESPDRPQRALKLVSSSQTSFRIPLSYILFGFEIFIRCMKDNLSYWM